MAFLAAVDFDTRYCVPGCETFVRQFLQVCSFSCHVEGRVTNVKQAWLEALTYQSASSDAVFTERETFIQLWKDSPFDLYLFRNYDVAKMKKRIAWLAQRVEDRGSLVQAELAAQIKTGTATREMVLLWVLQQEKAAGTNNEDAE